MATEIIWRYKLYKASRDAGDAAQLEWAAQQLAALADEVEATLGPNTWPGRPAAIRAFLADLRDVFPAYDETQPIEQTVLSAIAAEDVTADSATITWTSSAAATGQVEYGTNLPMFGQSSPLVEEITTEHSVTLTGLLPRTHYYFRVRSTGADGVEIVSGDYRLRTANE